MEVKPIVGAGDSTDIGQALQNLIKDNLARLNVAFLAVVQEVKDNKVVVNQVIKSKENEKLAIPSLLVGIPQTQSLKQSFKIKKGDFGLCIVCDSDISGYKQSGDKSEKMSSRTHDLIDSIFIPLSLYQSALDNNSLESEIDYTIASKGNLSLIGNLVSLKSQNQSLKTMLEELSDNISAIVTTGGYQLTPDAQLKFSLWKQKLSQLFKE